MASLDDQPLQRLATGSLEFDRVLGGGLVLLDLRFRMPDNELSMLRTMIRMANVVRRSRQRR